MESCTALAEDMNGRFEILRGTDTPQAQQISPKVTPMRGTRQHSAAGGLEKTASERRRQGAPTFRGATLIPAERHAVDSARPGPRIGVVSDLSAGRAPAYYHSSTIPGNWQFP